MAAESEGEKCASSTGPLRERLADFDPATLYGVAYHRVTGQFADHEQARAAARRAAAEQSLSGETEAIEYQDADGVWRVELA